MKSITHEFERNKINDPEGGGSQAISHEKDCQLAKLIEGVEG